MYCRVVRRAGKCNWRPRRAAKQFQTHSHYHQTIFFQFIIIIICIICIICIIIIVIIIIIIIFCIIIITMIIIMTASTILILSGWEETHLENKAKLSIYQRPMAVKYLKVKVMMMVVVMMTRRRKFVLYGMYIASPYMITEGQWRAVIRQIPDFLSK